MSDQKFTIIETPTGPLCVGGKIYEAMAAIMGEVQAVGKTGRNTQQNYSYRPVDEFLNALNPIMAKHQVTVRPVKMEVVGEDQRVPTKSGGDMLAVNRRVTFIFQHADGSFAFAQTEGYGMDSGDKAVNKAMAFSFKYLLMESFIVPTAELKDGDAESPERAARVPTATPPSNGKTQKAKVFTAELFEKSKDRIAAYLNEGHTSKQCVEDLKSKGYVVPRDVSEMIDKMLAELIDATS